MHPLPPLPDALGGRRYVLRAPLGRGGMAVVVRATDTALGVDRAIKIVFPQEQGTKGLRRRLRSEAKAMAAIHHPNILGIHDVGTEGDLEYVVMDLAAGGSLQDRLDATGPLPPAEAVALTIDLLGALSVAHSHGIIHRDVKPQNVLLDHSGRPLLADFGIALLAHDLRRTRAGSIMGSLAYMPPEQRLDAASVGPTADIYAMGATLYTLLTGENPVDLFLASDISPRWREVPEPLRPVLMDALSAAPELRWRTAGDMAEVLLRILAEGQLDGIAAVNKRFFAEPAAIFSAGVDAGAQGTLAPPDDEDPSVREQFVADLPNRKARETILPEPSASDALTVADAPEPAPTARAWWPAAAAAVVVTAACVWLLAPARNLPPPAPTQPVEAAAAPESDPAESPLVPRPEPAPEPIAFEEPATVAPSPPRLTAATPPPPAPHPADVNDSNAPWGTWEGSLGGVLLTLEIGAHGGTATTQFGPNRSQTTTTTHWSPARRTLVLRDDGVPPATYTLTVSADGTHAEGRVESSTHRRPVVLERR